MHDTHGFPLSESIAYCMENGAVPCLEQFVMGAIRAGWPRDRAERIVREGKADGGWVDLARLRTIAPSAPKSPLPFACDCFGLSGPPTTESVAAAMARPAAFVV